MSTPRYLSCSLSLVLCIYCSVATTQAVENHNSSRSNKGTLTGGGDDAADKDVALATDRVVRKKPGRTTYANITLAADAIEYGLIAALFSGDDSEAIEYALLLTLLTDMEQAASVDSDDKIVRKKPGLVSEYGELGDGNESTGSGTLRNNDPIPGIDVIVDKDPELNTSVYSSPVMLLNEMLKAGYSQAEVVEFALETGLIGP